MSQNIGSKRIHLNVRLENFLNSNTILSNFIVFLIIYQIIKSYISRIAMDLLNQSCTYLSKIKGECGNEAFRFYPKDGTWYMTQLPLAFPVLCHDVR